MWQAFFGFREPIFTPAVAAQMPLLPNQQVARHELLEALAAGHPIILLMGEAGVGKTRLLTDLAHEMATARSVVWMPPGVPQDVASLYQSLLFDLDLPWLPAEGTPPSAWENTWRLRLGEWLLSQAAAQRSVLIVAEDVHNWPDTVLQEWRQLVRFVPGSPGMVQVILSSQPSLIDRLSRAPLDAWATDLGYCVWLEPLRPEQAREHLHRAITDAGVSPSSVIEPHSVELLIRRTQGIPRLLHQATLRALQLAYAHEARPCQPAFVIAALEELGLVEGASESSAGLTNASAA